MCNSLTVNHISLRLSSLFLLLLRQLLSLMLGHNHSFKHVRLCHTNSVSALQWLIPRCLSPSSSLVADTPQDVKLPFQIAPKKHFFLCDCSTVFAINNGANVKKACMKWDHIQVVSLPDCLLLVSDTFVLCLLSFDWTQAAPQMPIQPTVPLSSSVVVLLSNPWWHWLSQAAALPELWKVPHNFSSLPWL